MKSHLSLIGNNVEVRNADLSILLLIFILKFFPLTCMILIFFQGSTYCHIFIITFHIKKVLLRSVNYSLKVKSCLWLILIQPTG